MRSYHRRVDGIERLVARAGRARVRPRHTVAVVLVLAGMTFVLWATFTQTYHLTNLYARLGLYGDPVRTRSGISLIDRYPVARTRSVNHRIEELGNVLLLAPLGVLLPLFWTGTRLRHVVVVSVVVSAAIEAGQWAFTPNRIGQWSDILQNASGAVAVFLLVAPVRWLYRRRRLSSMRRSAPVG